MTSCFHHFQCPHHSLWVFNFSFFIKFRIFFFYFFLQPTQSVQFVLRNYSASYLWWHFGYFIQPFTKSLDIKPCTSRHHHHIMLLKQFFCFLQSILFKCSCCYFVQYTMRSNKMMWHLLQFFH